VLHVNREALVSQREVGNDPARAAAALRAALREQPDVLVIEGVATPEVAQLTIDAASQERLVIASVEAASAASALTRLLELVPADHRQSTRASMARSFRGAVAQLVLRKTTGGRIAARELLAGTRAVRRAIADGELTQLSDLQSTGQGGTPPLSDSIVSYVRSGVVDVREALRKAPDGERLLGGLKAAGVDVAAVEGWH
jgi:twitching motility protein PilT